MVDRIASSTLHRQATNSILEQQRRLAEIQNQLARGLRLTQGSDDPAGIGEMARLDDALAGLERDRSNISTLRRRLGIEETALLGVTDTLQRIRELTVQGANATQSPESRHQLSLEIVARLDELVALANADDGNGRHLFAGTRDGATPFAVSHASVVYAGDDSARSIEIGNDRLVQDSDAGSAVFLRIPSGNGTFRVTPGAGNTGDAKVVRSQLADATAWDGQTYTMSFSGGSYDVVDESAVSVASGPYVEGELITFAGITLTLEGNPVDGDSLEVAPSRSQSLFATVQQLVNALGDSAVDPASSAKRHMNVQTGLADLDSAIDHVLGVRGSVGARLSVLDQAESQADAIGVELTQVLSNVRDLDYAEATTRLALQLTGLEAAQQSFIRVQGLSLFNLLR